MYLYNSSESQYIIIVIKNLFKTVLCYVFVDVGLTDWPQPFEKYAYYVVFYQIFLLDHIGG